MDCLITNQYQREAILTQRAQMTETSKASGAASREANAKIQSNVRNGSVVHTKASLGHTVAKQEEPQELFKLARYKNVPSRVRLVNQTGHQQSQQSPHAQTEQHIENQPLEQEF
jgi:hypothetical protein